MVPIFGSKDMFVWIQSGHSVAGTHHCLHPQWASFGRLIASSSILARLAGQICEHPLLVDLLACFRFWTFEFKRQVPLENWHQAVIIGCHTCLRQMPSIFIALYCWTLLSSICKGRSAPCRKSCGARPAAESINEKLMALSLPVFWLLSFPVIVVDAARSQVGKAVKKPGRQRDQKGPTEKRLLFVYGLSQQSKAWAGVTSKYLHLWDSRVNYIMFT